MLLVCLGALALLALVGGIVLTTGLGVIRRPW